MKIIGSKNGDPNKVQKINLIKKIIIAGLLINSKVSEGNNAIAGNNARFSEKVLDLLDGVPNVKCVKNYILRQIFKFLRRTFFL